MMTRLSLRTLTASTPLTLLTVAALTALFATVAVKGFELTVFGALALYFVLWWTFLFAILPLGNAAEADPQRLVPGQDPGAPASPRLRDDAPGRHRVLRGVADLPARPPVKGDGALRHGSRRPLRRRRGSDQKQKARHEALLWITEVFFSLIYVAHCLRRVG
jgi:hypothetical protein